MASLKWNVPLGMVLGHLETKDRSLVSSKEGYHDTSIISFASSDSAD